MNAKMISCERGWCQSRSLLDACAMATLSDLSCYKYSKQMSD